MAKKRNRTQRTTRRAGARPRPRAALREEFNPDYSYVIQDLRRIALLAGSFVVILVALSFVLK